MLYVAHDPGQVPGRRLVGADAAATRTSAPLAPACCSATMRPAPSRRRRCRCSTDDEVHSRLTALAARSRRRAGGRAGRARPRPGLAARRRRAGRPCAPRRSTARSTRRGAALSYTGAHGGHPRAAAGARRRARGQHRARGAPARRRGAAPRPATWPAGCRPGGRQRRRHRTRRPRLRAVTSPMADLPSGAAFGIVVHSLLEHADTTAPDLSRRADRARPRGAVAPRRGRPLDPEVLGPGPAAVDADAAGAASPGVARLADILPGDRLSELGFELPLAGGDRPTRRARRRSPRWPRCCADTSRPTTRSPRTPTCCRRCRRSGCAATSPGASTRCCGWDSRTLGGPPRRRSGRASSSPTTRPTGSAPRGPAPASRSRPGTTGRRR